MSIGIGDALLASWLLVADQTIDPKVGDLDLKLVVSFVKQTAHIDLERLFPDDASRLAVDHNFGNESLYATFQLSLEICAEDAYLIEGMAAQTQKFFGTEIVSRQQPPIGRLLKDGDIITFGNHQLKVLQTPGHSHGSCLFYCAEEKTVFTGDTLFRMSIGRTDFEEGSWTEMEQSLKKIATKLPKETIVLPGHGPQSTIADELQYNPYLR